MFGSAIVYSGLVTALIGLLLVAKPIPRLRVRTRSRGLAIAGAGMLLAGCGLMAPAVESRRARIASRLDEFMPAWQFHEIHTRTIAAPPERVFEAIKRVRADEIAFFRTLTWIRRGGRELPPGILNAEKDAPLIAVALEGGFVCLADEAPRELVLGTVLVAPRGVRGKLTPGVFQRPLASGFAVATINFRVTPLGANASTVSTETRVFANSAGSRRRFAAYWRLIYPGSAIIRRGWLRAIERRAIDGQQ